MHSFFCFLYPWMVQTFRYQVPRVLWLKWSPLFKLKNRSQGSKGDKNLLGFLLSFVNQLILHAINFLSRMRTVMHNTSFKTEKWNPPCRALPTLKSEFLNPLICCSYCWSVPPQQNCRRAANEFLHDYNWVIISDTKRKLQQTHVFIIISVIIHAVKIPFFCSCIH